MTARPVFFFHIPKTGGVSVVSAARAALGRPHVFGIYDAPVISVPSVHFASRVERLLQYGHLRFLHAHASPSSLPAEIAVRRTIVLRDPIDRLLSHFCFSYDRRHVTAAQAAFFLHPARLNRKIFGLADIIAWAEYFQADNFLTRYVAGRGEGVVDARDLVAAEQQLRKMDIIGFTHCLGNYLAELGQTISNSDFRIHHINHSNRSIIHLSGEDAQFLTQKLISFDVALYKGICHLTNPSTSNRIKAVTKGYGYGRSQSGLLSG